MEKVVRISENDYRALMRFDDDGGYADNVVYEVFSETAASFPDEPENGGDADASSVGSGREPNYSTQRSHSAFADSRN